MKSKLLVLMLLAGGSAFAESHWSISIGTFAPDYYEPPPVYYAPARPHVLHRWGGLGFSYGSAWSGYGNSWNGAGYWGEDPARQHERAEWYGLHNHQQGERFIYGDSPDLREHQAREQWELRHEQWHERNGDFGAADGPAHGSARDGWYH
jgi:hypothetical protein